MQPFKEAIRSSADLCSNYSEISRLCREEHEAVIITVDGHYDTVSVAYEQYQQMKAKIELLELLGEAEEDLCNERVAPMQDTIDSLRAELHLRKDSQTKN